MGGNQFAASTMAEKPRYIAARGLSDAAFPLTPALSPGERENGRQFLGNEGIATISS